MGNPLPEYTQRQLNELFARYILYNEYLYPFTEEYDVMRNVANGSYILKGEKE